MPNKSIPAFLRRLVSRRQQHSEPPTYIVRAFLLLATSERAETVDKCHTPREAHESLLAFRDAYRASGFFVTYQDEFTVMMARGANRVQIYVVNSTVLADDPARCCN